MFLVNSVEQDTLAANDHAVQSDDDCLSTAHIQQRRAALLDVHLQRLQVTCEKLQTPFHDWLTLNEKVQHLTRPHVQGVLEVVLTRGVERGGYSTTGCASPTRIFSVSPFPTYYARWWEEGITLAQSPVPLGRNPWLAGLKHPNRLEQILIRSHLEQTGADEALILDSNGWLTECCVANLFQRQGQDIFTPRLDYAKVNGIIRQHYIVQLAPSVLRVVEVMARPGVLREADEVLICNALIPLVPVRRWEETVRSSRELYHFLASLCELSGQYEENVTFYSAVGDGIGYRHGSRHVESTPAGG